MKRFAANVMAFLILLLLLPTIVFANSPPPAPWYTFLFDGLPAECVYVDLLIYLPEEDPCYVDLVLENVPESFPADAQIFSYCEGDYRSYTFHYRDALSDILVRNGRTHYFYKENEEIYTPDSLWNNHMESVEQRGEIKVALLDRWGRILAVSEPCAQKTGKLFTYGVDYFYYDLDTNTLHREDHFSTFALGAYLFLSVIGVILTVVIEYLVACMFGLRFRFGKMIVKTNLISQILMYGLYLIIGLSGLGYGFIVLLLEIAVYSGEYFFYRSWMQDISHKKILCFTIAANTASLWMGLMALQF